ncbi:UDP-N-acetylglucosamine 1-carboxyvinyltransferase [Candidatus Bipolaricaulota bacterium]|nr:UDP-N-acetylglucosamine 1-carboxyvinyltransferase [Candidatus Bipolaricaulota bacterium]
MSSRSTLGATFLNVMEQLIIRGGRPLSGRIVAGGAKNAALPACVAALLTDEPIILHRIPALLDVATILATITSLGKRVIRDGDTVEIRGGPLLDGGPSADYVKQMRASFIVLGPLLVRTGRANVDLPGGCNIGGRPVDFHLAGLAALGATIEERCGVVVATAGRLCGTRIVLPYPSVGATQHLIMTAALAEGETVIANPSREPEVADLISLLVKMGARIETTPEGIRISGRDRLHGAEHTVIPDRLEVGTYLLAGAITGGEVEVGNAVPTELAAFLDVLRETGMEIVEGRNTVGLSSNGRPDPVRVRTAPHPGFPTDLHPPLTALLTLGRGESRIEETVFERRFGYVPELNRMGARIATTGDSAVIAGVKRLHSASVDAPDIRAGAALLLAGLAAEGKTVIHKIEQIDRGYAMIEEKLKAIGAQIEREP